METLKDSQVIIDLSNSLDDVINVVSKNITLPIILSKAEKYHKEIGSSFIFDYRYSIDKVENGYTIRDVFDLEQSKSNTTDTVFTNYESVSLAITKLVTSNHLNKSLNVNLYNRNIVLDNDNDGFLLAQLHPDLY